MGVQAFMMVGYIGKNDDHSAMWVIAPYPAFPLASQPSFRLQTHPVEGDKPFTQAFENWEGDAWEQWQSYVPSQFSEWAFTSKPQGTWTDPPSCQPQIVTMNRQVRGMVQLG